MPQVQHGSTILLPGLRWKRAQLLSKVPKPQQKAQDVAWPWATHLAAATTVTFVPDTGLDQCLVFTSSSFSQAEEPFSSWGWRPDIWASNSFCSQAKLYLANGLQPIVRAGFPWLEASGGCNIPGLECSCRACCKNSICLILSFLDQDQSKGTIDSTYKDKLLQ